MRSRARAVRAAGAVLGLAAALLALGPTAPASAHAFLTASTPADGSSSPVAPTELRLDLSESVVLDATRIEITDGTGRTVRPTSVTLRAGDPAATEQPAQVVAALPPLPRGAYRVSWQTLSSDDLHRTSGVLVFGVGATVHAAAFAEPAPRAEEAALRWALFVCLGAALGGQLAVRLHRHSGAPDPAGRERCRRLAAGGAALGLLVALGLLADQVAVSGTSVGALAGGPYGQRWAVREAGLALLLVAGWRGWGWGANRIRATLVSTGAVAVAVGSALLGHSGAGAGTGPTRVAADAAHLLATATWAGMLVVVAVALLRRRGADATATAAVLRGFRLPAAAAVAVLVVTGVYLAGGVVGSVDAALLTTYGRVLLLKLALVAVALVLGLVNTRRVHRRAGGAVPGRTVLAEAGTAVVVLALAAVLTAGQPAREPRFVAAPAAPTVPLVDVAVADLQESLAVRPNVPGRNVVLVQAHDTRRPALAPVRRVLVAVVPAPGSAAGSVAGRAATPVVADRVDTADSWSATVDLPAAGRSRLQVTVQRPGVPDVTHVYAWTVGADPQAVPPATVSNTPVQGALTAAAAVLALVALALAAATGWRRRGARRQDPAAGPAGRPGGPVPVSGTGAGTGAAPVDGRAGELTAAGR